MVAVYYNNRARQNLTHAHELNSVAEIIKTVCLKSGQNCGENYEKVTFLRLLQGGAKQ